MHFKEKFVFLPLPLVTNPFLSHLLLPPPHAVDCIIDANTVTCVSSWGSSSLLLCNILSQNIKWRKQPHGSGGKSACQWTHSCTRLLVDCFIRVIEYKKKKNAAANSSLCFGALCYIYYLALRPPSRLWRHLNASLANSHIFLQISTYLQDIPSKSAAARITLLEHTLFFYKCAHVCVCRI